MNFVIIALSIVVIFLLFLVYRYVMASSSALVTNISLKSGPPDIALSKLKIKDYNNYNIEFWIYVHELPAKSASIKEYTIADYKDNFNTNIFSTYPQTKVLEIPSCGLSIDIYPNGTFTFYNGRNYGSNPNVSAFMENFPIQKWTYVIVSIRNNSLVDLFMNGKLIQSSNYDGIEKMNYMYKPNTNSTLQFGKQLNALISKMYINSTAMDTTTALNNYLKGNGSTSNMNISFNLTKDGKNSSNFKIL